MAAGNVFTIGIALQSGKGSPATVPQFLMQARSADLGPVTARERIEETGQGRDGGQRYTTRISLGGGMDLLARAKTLPLFLYGLLGARAATAPTAPETRHTHILTPANDQPWFTIWRFLGDVLFERFDDCKIVAGTFTGSAGGLVASTYTVKGLKPQRLPTMPVGGDLDTSFPFRVPEAVYSVEGANNDAIREWTLGITADQNEIQTNKIFDSYLEPGLRTIELSYTELFTSLDRYNKVLYGSASGTEVSENIYRNQWKGLFIADQGAAGPTLEFDVPNLAYMAAPLTPSAGGDPLQMGITGAADTPQTGSIISAAVKNDQPASAYAAAV